MVFLWIRRFPSTGQSVHPASLHSFDNQFSSVAQLCLTLCDSMDCSTPGFPVHHQFPELAQTPAHQVGNAIQPSHPLSSPSPPTFILSQHQGLIQWVSSSHQLAKALAFSIVQLSHPYMTPGKTIALTRRTIVGKVGRKRRRTKEPLDESETGEWKSWLKTQHAEKYHGIWSHHFMENRWGNNGNSERLYFGGASKSLQMVTAAMKLKNAFSLEEKLWPM